MDHEAASVNANDDDDYDWSAAVEEIDRIHQGELVPQAIRQTALWGQEPVPQNSHLRPIRVPVNAVQRPLTSFFESGPAQRPFGEVRALAEAENARREEETAPEAVPIDPEAATTWIYPDNVSRREYQYQIVARALYENVLVSLPTGLGKTFIAAVLMYNYFRWFPEGKVVFLAPSKPLVNQQVEACYGIMGIPQDSTSEMTGAVAPTVRKGLWQEKRVFFLTPQTLEQDLYTGICPRQSVVLIVIDEAHRATGNHSYCNIIREMESVRARYRILALTATPGSDFNAIQNVINNLRISRLEHRGEDHAEVAMYTHSKEKVLVPVEMDKNSANIRTLFAEAIRPMLGRLCSFGAFYSKDVTAVTAFQILDAKTRFMANPPPHVHDGSMREISTLFHILHSLFLAMQLLTSDGVQQSFKYLEGKLEDNSLLRAHRARDARFLNLLDAMRDLVRRGAPAPKLLKLEEILAEHFARHDPEHTRVIIFSERRESVKDINEMLKKHAPKVRSTEFKGQASGRNNKGQSQKRQQAVLKEFRSGAFNVIVSTSIGEEGLDIGEVDLVICFDASASPLRMIQRMGRTGRKRQGRVVILAAMGKEVRDYEKNQAKMRTVQKKMQNGGQDFEKHTSPRMIPHAFRPTMRTAIMDIPEYIHRGNKTVRVPLLVDPGAEELGAEEQATLARWPFPERPWAPSLIAFSNFQSQPSKVYKVRHGARTTELFVGVLQRLQDDPPETELRLEWGAQNGPVLLPEGGLRRHQELPPGTELPPEGVLQQLRDGPPQTEARLERELQRLQDGAPRPEPGDDVSDDVSDQGLDIFASKDTGRSKRAPKRARIGAAKGKERGIKVVGGELPGAQYGNLDQERMAERAGPGPSSVRLQGGESVRTQRADGANPGRLSGEEDGWDWGDLGFSEEGEKAPAEEPGRPWSPPRPQFTPPRNARRGETTSPEGFGLAKSVVGVRKKSPVQSWGLYSNPEEFGGGEGSRQDVQQADDFGEGAFEFEGDTWQAEKALPAPRGVSCRDVWESEMEKRGSGEPVGGPLFERETSEVGGAGYQAESLQGSLPRELLRPGAAPESVPEAISNNEHAGNGLESTPEAMAAVQGEKSSDETSSDGDSSADGGNDSSDERAEDPDGVPSETDGKADGSVGEVEGLEGGTGGSDSGRETDWEQEHSLRAVTNSGEVEEMRRSAGGDLRVDVNPGDKRIKITPKRSRLSSGASKEQPESAIEVPVERQNTLCEVLKTLSFQQIRGRLSQGSPRPRPLGDLSPNVGHGGPSRSLEDIPLAALGRLSRPEAQSPGAEALCSNGGKGGAEKKRKRLTLKMSKGEGLVAPTERGPVNTGDELEAENVLQPGMTSDGLDAPRENGSCSDVDDLPLASRLGKKKTGRRRTRAEAEKTERTEDARVSVVEVTTEEKAGEKTRGRHAELSERAERRSGVSGEGVKGPKEELGMDGKEGAACFGRGREEPDRHGRPTNDTTAKSSGSRHGSGSGNLYGSQRVTICSQGLFETNEERRKEENCFPAERSDQSQKSNSAVPSMRFDPDAVVPDSESEEEDTWRLPRATARAGVGRGSSQRNAGTGLGNAKLSQGGNGSTSRIPRGRVIEASELGTREENRPADSAKRNGGSERAPGDAPGSVRDAPASQPVSEPVNRGPDDRLGGSPDTGACGRLPLPAPKSPERSPRGMVPESPDSVTRALHALSSQVQSPIAYESPDCRVPETPDSTAGGVAERHVSQEEAREEFGAVEQSPDEAVPKSPRSSLAREKGADDSVPVGAGPTESKQRNVGGETERGLKPVPFPGFSPLPSSLDSPYPSRGDFSGVVPETPDSAFAPNQATSQQNGAKERGDLLSGFPPERSPVTETPPGPQRGAAAQNPVPDQENGVKAESDSVRGFPSGWSPVPVTPSASAAETPTAPQPNSVHGQGESGRGVSSGWSPVPETPPDPPEAAPIFGRPSGMPIGQFGPGSQRGGLPQGFGSPHQGSNWPLGSGGDPRICAPAAYPFPAVQSRPIAPRAVGRFFGRPETPGNGVPEGVPNGGNPIQADSGRNGMQQNGSQRDGNFPVRKPLPRLWPGPDNSNSTLNKWHNRHPDLAAPQQAATCHASSPRGALNRPIAPLPNPETLGPSPSQWERLNASLREQSSAQVENRGLQNLVRLTSVEGRAFQSLVELNMDQSPILPRSPGPITVAVEPHAGVAQPPSHVTSAAASHDVSNDLLSSSCRAPIEAREPRNPPDLAVDVNAPPPPSKGPFTPTEAQPGAKGPVNRSPASHRSSGEWMPTSQAPTGPPSVEPPRKLRRLRKANGGTESIPRRNQGEIEGAAQEMERNVADVRKEPRAESKAGRKEAIQSLLQRGKGHARNLASVFFDEEAEVSGDESATSDESGDGPEEDDSFIDDRSQVTASGAATTPSAGTEASPGDMMALYRRSLLTQSPLEDASPLNAPRFKSPPRAQANKNFGKMVFLPGRRRSEGSEEAAEASLGYEESLESEEGMREETADRCEREDPEPDRGGAACHVAGADRGGAAGKKRKLAFPEPQDKQLWTPWPIGKADGVSAGAHAAGGWRGATANAPSAPLERPWLDRRTNPAEVGLVGVQGAVRSGHVAAPEGDTREDDFLEGLDLDRLEAEALAARCQQPPPRTSVTSGRPDFIPDVPGAARAVGMSKTSFDLSGFGKTGLPQGEAARGALVRTPIALEKTVSQVATSGGRLRKRRSLEDDDGMPSFDLGLD